MIPVLGVDPGDPGAATLADVDGTVLACFYWRELKRETGPRVWRVSATVDGKAEAPVDLPSLHAIGAWIRDRTLALLLGLPGPPSRVILIVEGLFVGKNARSALTLGEFTAMVYGPLLEIAVNADLIPDPTSPWRPKAGNGNDGGWRRTQLGRLPGRPANRTKAWKKLAVDRLHLVGAATDLGELRLVAHVAESYWIAREGIVRQRTHLARTGRPC